MFRTSLATVSVVALTGLALATPPAAMADHQLLRAGSTPGKSLTVIVAGLPSGSKGRVKVTGPGGYRITLSLNGTKTLQNLRAGKYRVLAKKVGTPFGKAKATKQTRVSSVRISKSKGAKVTLLYVTPGTS